MSHEPEVLVVGGGPAGLTAAAAAAHGGADVLLVDENPTLGGSLRYRAQSLAISAGDTPLRPDAVRGRLVQRATEEGASLQTGVIAAGWYPGGKVLLVNGETAWLTRPKALVVASGSTDLPFPIAGATLPGVFSARATQILINQWRVLPGQRFVIIGSGSDADDLAIDIAMAGGEVVSTLLAPAHTLSIEGEGQVQRLINSGDRFDVDCVVIATGRQPDASLATMAGARLGFDPQLGGLVPLLTGDLQATPGVFVAGDAAGVGSIEAAIAEGEVAGAAAARFVRHEQRPGRISPDLPDLPEVQWRRQRREALPAVHSQPYQ